MRVEERNSVDYLMDILDSIEKIEDFIEGFNFEEFSKDTKTIYAVVRALEIIGEATKNLPDSLRSNHPDVPWKDMAGFRDKVVHGYFGVDLEVVWDTAVEDAPYLKSLIIKILDEKEKESC
ncbi:hypothetical protein MSLAZ_2054 [Methanosarcina lacustris Z-7289]|uniref:Nucleotidyltransferase n=1 Tax=Methanosarcina lacustris Z-7289 TaxID=1434111 RepID=A0A0E3WSZ6_9EURY|nr:DUF86 domain-containing protein [Methanosarcina lacustris]AKB75315.1 hypothetical protein MSLAZ_2054 [Methanosarcina lacustris Z-7289]